MSAAPHLTDRSSAADQHMDEFCFYSEARALYAVGRVTSTQIKDGMLHVTIGLYAVAERGLGFKQRLDKGTSIEVSCRREGGWNQVWMLFPLGTNDLDEAIRRVAEVRPSSKRWTWQKTGPSSDGQTP